MNIGENNKFKYGAENKEYTNKIITFSDNDEKITF